MIEPGRYDWEEHEPDAYARPYGSRADAERFVLAPVTSWEHRTRIEIAANNPDEWWLFNFCTDSLIEQLSLTAFRSPNGRTDRKGRGITVDEHGNSLWLDSGADCLRILDWLWEAFRVRLGNRVHEAYKVGGMTEVYTLCDGLADRFDVNQFEFGVWPAGGGTVTGEPVPRGPSAELHRYYRCDFNGYLEEAWGRFLSTIDTAKVDARRVDMNRPLDLFRPQVGHDDPFGELAAPLTTPAVSPTGDGADPSASDINTETGPVAGEPYFAPPGGDEGWDGCIPLGVLDGPFQLYFDPAVNDVCSASPGEPIWLDSLVPEPSATEKPAADEPAPFPMRPFSIRGHAAPGYAETIRAAVRQDPSLRRASFAALAEAAGIAGDEAVRTVSRAIEKATGWKHPARDVEAFVSVLFVAVGEDVPT